MKTLGIKTISILLLGIWILIHLPLNLLHHHETVCNEANKHERSGEFFHLHKSAEELCFFCSKSFVKELEILSQDVEFSIKLPELKISTLCVVKPSLLKGQTTGRAPPL